MSTIRSRELGEALRSAMERANLNGKRTATILGWSESRVSRLLTTLVPCSERSGTVPAADVEQRVAARLGRQSLLSRQQRPQFTFYLHEFVLRLPVGGPEVMSEQLPALLRPGVRSYINIRVIPVAAGAHAGTAGSCSLMEFTEFKPVV